MANAEVVISKPGPLPVKGYLHLPRAGTVLLMLAGSVYSLKGQARVGVELLLDDDVQGEAAIYASENNTHYALVPIFVTADLKHGEHRIEIRALNGLTVGDEYDYFSVAALI
jgi:hypothetical protein